MKIKIFFLAMLFFTAFSFNSEAQSGANDLTFNPTDIGFGFGDGANDLVKTTAIQSDGKIIIGGIFSSYNGSTTNRIARLNTDGTLDDTFSPGTGANYTVLTTAIQSDGKIIVGGNFTSYNGITRNGIVRLNADGTFDATFNPGTGVNGSSSPLAIYTTTIQSDGKIIIGGNFTSYNGITRNRIARLNTDGTLDATFNTAVGASYPVYTTAIQSDGKIIIGGYFSSYNGITRNCIARLNADGTLDTSFNPGTGADNYVNTTAIQSDGKIIIGGNFTSYNGTTRNSIARLNADGTLDATFNPGTGTSYGVYTTAIQSDGKIIIGGAFTYYNGTKRNLIARLNADGTLDVTFNPGTGASREVYTTAKQSDGKIIIGGTFTSYNGTTRNYTARLNADGTLDASFNSGTGASREVYTTTIQSDGKIIIGGNFTSYNGVPINRIARLNADGTLDTSFHTGTGARDTVRTTAIQSDGKIIIGGDFYYYNETIRKQIARLNTDGTLDASFDPGNGATNSTVYTTAIQSDGKIIIGGNFTSYNGTNINHIIRLNANGTLDATFNSGTGTNLPVLTTAIQSDGKIIIGGRFTFYNGIRINKIARLNADGTLDTSFYPRTSATSSTVYTTVIQSDGKIIIGGDFTSYNGTIINGIARLNGDGTLDTTFNPGTGANSSVNATAIQSDGKIIIGGDFTSYNGTTINRIARLNADGTLDTAFNPGSGASSVSTTAIQSDGKIIIGGEFTSYNGTGRNRVARITNSNSNGISSLQPQAISIYPNPVLDELHIEVVGNNEQIKFEVLNSMGQVVSSGNLIERTTLQTSNLSTGVYLIKLGNNKVFELKKIVKE